MRIAGILLIVVGVAIAAYSAYRILTFNPTATLRSISGSGQPVLISGSGGIVNYRINGTRFSGANPFTERFSFLSPYLVVIGILTALLGFATLKYTELRLQTL